MGEKAVNGRWAVDGQQKGKIGAVLFVACALSRNEVAVREKERPALFLNGDF